MLLPFPTIVGSPKTLAKTPPPPNTLRPRETGIHLLCLARSRGSVGMVGLLPSLAHNVVLALDPVLTLQLPLPLPRESCFQTDLSSCLLPKALLWLIPRVGCKLLPLNPLSPRIAAPVPSAQLAPVMNSCAGGFSFARCASDVPRIAYVKYGFLRFLELISFCPRVSLSDNGRKN